VLNLVDRLPSVELRLDHFICLKEALQLTREFVVLLGDQIDVSVKRLHLAGLPVRFINQLGVVVLQNVELVLQRLDLASARLQTHLSV